MLKSDEYEIAMRYRKLSTMWSVCKQNEKELESTLTISPGEKVGLALITQEDWRVLNFFLLNLLRLFLNHIFGIVFRKEDPR